MIGTEASGEWGTVTTVGVPRKKAPQPADERIGVLFIAGGGARGRQRYSLSSHRRQQASAVNQCGKGRLISLRYTVYSADTANSQPNLSDAPPFFHHRLDTCAQ